jgi:integrase/recombinase XerC
MSELRLWDQSIASLVNTFLKGRNANTLSAYRADLLEFSAYLNSPDIITSVATLFSLSHGSANLLMLNYKNSLKERGLKSASVNRKLSSVRAVVKLARMAGIISWSIEVPNEKVVPYRDTRGVGTSGVNSILQILYVKGDAKSLRDIAIIRLLYDVGLRVSEVLGLDMADLDSENSSMTILGKGRTQKQKMTLPSVTFDALKDWISVRHDRDSSAIFLNFDRSGIGNGRITRAGVYKLIKILGNKINMKANPHGFRHSGITAAVKEAQKNGIELPSVLQYSRHSDLSTLQVYIDNIADRQGEIASLVAGTVKGRKQT